MDMVGMSFRTGDRAFGPVPPGTGTVDDSRIGVLLVKCAFAAVGSAGPAAGESHLAGGTAALLKNSVAIGRDVRSDFRGYLQQRLRSAGDLRGRDVRTEHHRWKWRG
ncbi:hypothetical protein Rhe02_49770 [Rhizocola hellebori]|uniref:Uncharacterized protein n=1 Tax=Rhizocola hellebori TaxID=1392758 RepID=A0A8J3VHV8_9ACTN|nr:hypothetical protein Rhe02_49770 [Rhizocola hellebori]